MCVFGILKSPTQHPTHPATLGALTVRLDGEMFMIIYFDYGMKGSDVAVYGVRRAPRLHLELVWTREHTRLGSWYGMVR